MRLLDNVLYKSGPESFGYENLPNSTTGPVPTFFLYTFCLLWKEGNFSKPKFEIALDVGWVGEGIELVLHSKL